MSKSTTLCDVCGKIMQVPVCGMPDHDRTGEYLLVHPATRRTVKMCMTCEVRALADWLADRTLCRDCEECQGEGALTSGEAIERPCPTCTPPWKRQKGE